MPCLWMMPAMRVAARRSSSSGRPRVKLLIMGRPGSRHSYRQAHSAHDQGLAEKMEREVAHEGRVYVLFEEPLVAAGQNLVVIPANQGLVLPPTHGAMVAPRTGADKNAVRHAEPMSSPRLPRPAWQRSFPEPGCLARRVRGRVFDLRRSCYLSWLTILGSGLTRRCDLHVPGSRKLNLRTNPGP
jgi:hypothetical protein